MILNRLINCTNIEEAKCILDSKKIIGINRVLYLFKAAPHNRFLMMDYYKQGILLLSHEDMKSYELLLCGLAYEKIGEYELAINYLNTSLITLPESSWSYAIRAMIERNNYKKSTQKKYLKEAKKNFEKARDLANEQWLINKWAEAVDEMRWLENA